MAASSLFDTVRDVGKKKKTLKLKQGESKNSSELAEARSFRKLKSSYYLIICVLIGLGIGYLLGYYSHNASEIANVLNPLRIDGNYKYISPLLACDTEIELESDKTKGLESKIGDYVDFTKSHGDIKTMSVYVRDYNGGNVVNYNPDTTYNQASLSKVPVMIKILETASKDPGYLSKTFVYSAAEDFNQGMDIKPSKFLIPGNQYTIEDALKMMIEYSDNNATYYLMNSLDQNTYNNIYKDLNISPPTSTQIENYLDFRTAKEYSYFLRVLYNATYLDRAGSEKAIELLTNSDYKNGLRAGLPENVAVAHKFGYLTHLVDGAFERELHDCGIVYKDGNKPYLICVMTKSNASLEKQEASIAAVSKLVHEGLGK